MLWGQVSSHWNVLKNKLALATAGNGANMVRVQKTLAAAVAMSLAQNADAQLINVRDYMTDAQWADFTSTSAPTLDISGAIQAAVDAGDAFNSAVVLLPYGGHGRCDSGLTYNADKISLWGGGCILDFSNMVSGVALTPAQAGSDANLRNAFNHSHCVKDLILLGPGVTTTAVAAIDVHDGSAPNTISGGKLENIAFIDFAEDIKYRDGAFCIVCENCNFTQTTGGTATTYSITIPTATNGGERLSFRSCMWNNKARILSQANANATTYLYDCSLDGFTVAAFSITGGAVKGSLVHMECSHATATYGSVSGTNSLLLLDQLTIIQQVNRTADFFTSDGSCEGGGVLISGINFALGVTVVGSDTDAFYLVGGAGRAAVYGPLAQQIGQARPLLCRQQNLLYHGDFESANFESEWTLEGSSPPTRVATEAYEGTNSLELNLPVGDPVTTTAYVEKSVKPGQFVFVEYRYLIPATAGTGWTFYFQADWLDAGGNVISNIFNSTTGAVQATWRKANPSVGEAAPAGAASFRLTFGGFGPVATDAAAMYIDHAAINVV